MDELIQDLRNQLEAYINTLEVFIQFEKDRERRDFDLIEQLERNLVFAQDTRNRANAKYAFVAS